MAQLPTAYVPHLFAQAPGKSRDGMSAPTLSALVERLDQAQVHSPAVLSLLRGKLLLGGVERAALLVLGDTRLDSVAQWADALAAASFASLVACSCADVGAPGYLRAIDAPLLTGHGIVVASRGVSGRALVGLPLEELRHELLDSRRRLSELAGYPVRTLIPTPSTLGAAVDGLVLEEARRAGYRLVLRPGRAITELDAPLARGYSRVVDYRTVRTDDSASHLHRWIVGHGLSRRVAQVRELVNRPRRILGRLGLQ